MRFSSKPDDSLRVKNIGAISALAVVAAVWAVACSAGSGNGVATDEGDGEGDGDGDGDICISDCGDGDGAGAGAGQEGQIPSIDQPATANCGDGIINPEVEACDDGNNDDGDGCWGNCRGVERGYICREAGTPCEAFAKCGDGAIIFPEQCDDANTDPGDGCSATCKVEIGFKCEDGVCTPTTCGDDIVEGAEMCEPNLDERCTSQCQFAPNCSGDGACTSECGDGLVLGEDCDDGNRQNGDGCDENCQVEEGYTCSIQEGDCERSASGECILRVPVTYRDFSTSHGAFQSDAQCGKGLTTGNVEPTLSAGIPVATNPDDVCWAVGRWYQDSAESVTFHSEMVLYENGDGGYVNRWGPNGERWEEKPTYENLRWCGTADAACGNCDDFDPDTETCWTSDWPVGCCNDCSCAGSEARHFQDGNPLFFPLDGLDGTIDDGGFESLVEPQYGYDYESEASIFDTDPVLHNFHFTSEVTFWFPYDEDTDATLDFTGDDDVYVYINGRLAVDLGGFHGPLSDSFTVSGSSPTIAGGTGAEHGMTPGNVYEIKVFHAERQTTGSTFKLTLSGFNSRRSDCVAVCGDGVIGFGEECDDGVNDGGYNECGADCTLGSYCGDGVKDPGEACDDNDPEAPPNCSGCNNIVVR